MALSLAVWIDRVRVHRHVPGPRIEGETSLNTSRSKWLPARIPPQDAQESLSGDRPRVIQDLREITCALNDEDGVRIEILKSDYLEVQMGPGPNYTDLGEWEVISHAIPRNGVGQELLQHIHIVKREEY